MITEVVDYLSIDSIHQLIIETNEKHYRYLQAAI